MTGALLSIPSITSFASLTRAGTRMESSLQSGNFLALSSFAKQAIVSSSSNSNNSSDVSYYKKLFVACIDSLAEPAHAGSQPGSTQLAFAHSIAHTT